MQSVRTLLWVLMAVLLTLFAAANWTEVELVMLPGVVEVDSYLSIVIVVTFLLGFLPPYLVNMTNRWRLQRKIKQQDDTIAMLRPTPAPTPPPVVADPLPTPLSATDSAL